MKKLVRWLKEAYWVLWWQWPELKQKFFRILRLIGILIALLLGILFGLLIG